MVLILFNINTALSNLLLPFVRKAQKCASLDGEDCSSTAAEQL